MNDGDVRAAYFDLRQAAPKKMKIGLDFDGTITEDPRLWGYFTRKVRSRGHEIVVVTFRLGPLEHGENKDIADWAAAWGNIPVIFTAGKQKAACYNADVWIDDHPELIPVQDTVMFSGGQQFILVRPLDSSD